MIHGVHAIVYSKKMEKVREFPDFISQSIQVLSEWPESGLAADGLLLSIRG